MDGRLMEISVIIPCYNLEKYIERCLLSIIEQVYDKSQFEVIIVLDSCTDMSNEIVRKTLEQSKIRSKIINTNVLNAGLARNIGLEAAVGEYVYFIDGDDYLIDNKALQKLKDNILINNTNAVYMTTFESEDKEVVEKDAIWRFFYKRSILGNTKFLQVPINEDWLFVWAIRRKREYKESKMNDLLYHYTHPREGSITAKYAHKLNDLNKSTK